MELPGKHVEKRAAFHQKAPNFMGLLLFLVKSETRRFCPQENRRQCHFSLALQY
jgi:hypothetical protein